MAQDAQDDTLGHASAHHDAPSTSPQVERMAQDAQADLDKALPAFESAVKSLKSLSKSDLVEVKGYAWHLMASDGL